MPTVRRGLRKQRRQWDSIHFGHLLCGHEWPFLPGEGWGTLSEKTDDEIRATIQDMADCWDHHGHNLRELVPGLLWESPPWFAAYADDHDKLFREAHKQRSYMEYQDAKGCYRPYSEFEQQYIPASPRATA